jgi:L-ascorbate metabolism protein UlaG (beta-lactamase superfamily)
VVRLVHLGHAFWLLEAERLRIAFDPLIGPTHTGGVFTLAPPRRIVGETLRADFVFVSHAHADHFDPPSLALLARLDPETVVVTPDALVAEICRTVGFRTVREIAAGTRIELDGGLWLATTPSRAHDVEWGIVAADRSGCAWNLVDTVFDSPHEVVRVRDLATGGRSVDVALAPLEPMREIALATSGRIGFAPREYGHLLACAAAVRARCVVPSAAGDAHAPPFDAMNASAYPISCERAVRDLSRLAPETRVLMPALGEALVLEGGAIGIDAGDVGVEILGEAPRQSFRPFEPAPLFDPNLDARDPEALRAAIRRWVHAELAPAVARELGDRDDLQSAVLVLEIVYPGDREAFRFDTRGNVEERFDDDYDVLNVIAASLLLDVIEGRRTWGEPLHGGVLRSSVRGLSIEPGSVRRLSIAPMFLYYALSYRDSVARAARRLAQEM